MRYKLAMSIRDPKHYLEAILASYKAANGIVPCDGSKLPQPGRVDVLIAKIRDLLLPGYYDGGRNQDISKNTLHRIEALTPLLQGEIDNCIVSGTTPCEPNSSIKLHADQIVDRFLLAIPALRVALHKDIQALDAGDPAAKSEMEIILAYPGFQAIMLYRIAHFFYREQVPLLPRMITERAHTLTGVDIHPGAQIGGFFCIDHGTGIVIGETTIIGSHVKLYQGVTLGALSVVKTDCQTKRHPTIGDNVTIYARTTILGGDTVIGHDSIIGGNVWLTESVPPFSKIYLTNNREQVIKSNKE